MRRSARVLFLFPRARRRRRRRRRARAKETNAPAHLVRVELLQALHPARLFDLCVGGEFVWLWGRWGVSR